MHKQFTLTTPTHTHTHSHNTQADMVDAAQLEAVVQDIRNLLTPALPHLQPKANTVTAVDCGSSCALTADAGIAAHTTTVTAAAAAAATAAAATPAARGTEDKQEDHELDVAPLVPMVCTVEEARRVAGLLATQVPSVSACGASASREGLQQHPQLHHPQQNHHSQQQPNNQHTDAVLPLHGSEEVQGMGCNNGSRHTVTATTNTTTNGSTPACTSSSSTTCCSRSSSCSSSNSSHSCNGGSGREALHCTHHNTAHTAFDELTPPTQPPSHNNTRVHEVSASASPAPHIIPIFAVSAVTGAGLDCLHAFLASLQGGSANSGSQGVNASVQQQREGERQGGSVGSGEGQQGVSADSKEGKQGVNAGSKNGLGLHTCDAASSAPPAAAKVHFQVSQSSCVGCAVCVTQLCVCLCAITLLLYWCCLSSPQASVSLLITSQIRTGVSHV